MKQKGFTLAEVMIVLTVIGIISAIIMPIARQNIPDKNVMLFKKGHNTLYRVISELVNSDKYYRDGDLGFKADGTQLLGSYALQRNESTNTNTKLTSGEYVDEEGKYIKYFCNTFADVVSTKSVNCSDATTSLAGYYSYINVPNVKVETWQLTPAEAQTTLDAVCKDSTVVNGVGAEIVTTDGITYYQSNPGTTFGIMWNISTRDPRTLFGIEDDVTKMGYIYKILCMDVDGLGQGEDPFGYGIRGDGRIFNSKRVEEWLDKDLQGDD